MEGLKVADGNLVIYVPPSKSKNVSDAILSELSSQLFKFSESLDGVLLAYDVDMVGNLAKILPGIHPFFGVKLKSKLLLFNPKPNMLLEGKVVKLSQHAIHVIVLGFSSAVIIEEDIPKEFRYKIVGKDIMRTDCRGNTRSKLEQFYALLSRVLTRRYYIYLGLCFLLIREVPCGCIQIQKIGHRLTVTQRS